MKVTRALLILIILSESVSYASAQPAPPPFAVEGVLTDPHGAAIVGADVLLTATAVELRTKSDDSGRFRFESVLPTAFNLVIVAEGFSRFERSVNPSKEPTTSLSFVLTPSQIFESVTVSVTRTSTRIGDNTASIAVLRAHDLEATAAITVDDALRQIPGFSLFRRSGSRTANPTSQGVSLRGLGASGASRAIVLSDGIPLNDPFGGWVYWSRVPRDSIHQMEVLRGGASDLYGSSALAGVVSIVTKRPEANTLSLEASYGNQATPDASLYSHYRHGNWSASLAAGIFRTDGYVLVDENQRGAVDTAAGSRHSVINLNLERSFGDNRRLFGSASFFGDSRTNGTPLQTNRTHIRHFTLGTNWQSSRLGFASARLFGGTQVFDQSFSAVSADRNGETLTRVQRVPAQFLGFNAQWTRAFGSNHTVIAGVDANQVRGASDEIVFVSGRATSLVGAGGRQATVGAYLQDVIAVTSRLLLNVSIRVDHWRNYDALSASKPLRAVTSTTVFADRTESAFSPRLSLLYKVTPKISLTASMTRAFRAPTLNELYRPFRVGDVITLANENLRAERLTGGEAGTRVSALRDRLVVRSTFFWAEVSQPVANVTLFSTPLLITRQRQNLGRTRSRGVEIETEARVKQFWNLSAGYLFADATLVKFPANTSLEGLMIPQVARHQFTFQARYSNPSIVTLGLQCRSTSSQFDDDQNLFRLAPFFTLDGLVSRRVTRTIDAFVAIENLFNRRYEVGKTPVTTLGPPILVRVGVRFHLDPN